MNRRAFTLVELLVAMLLVAVAVVCVMGGLRALAAADAAAKRADLLQSLAAEKAHEVLATETASTASGSGTFSEKGYADISYVVDVQASGTEYVDELTVKAYRGTQSQTVTCLFYARPSSKSATSK